MLFVVLGAVVVFVIAAAAVGGMSGRLASEPKLAVFDLDDAVDYVAERLPFEVAAHLTHDDVRQIISWHLDFMESRGVYSETDVELDGPDVVVDEDDALASVLGAVSDAGLEVADDEVATVLALELAYTTGIGGVGPEAAGG